MLKKEIVIKNNKDLNSFYKKLKFYKYLFFVKFETNNNEIQDIISALNIKKCYCQQYKGCKYTNGCCRLCIYQSNKGCKTSNLTCKFYYCTEVHKRYKVLNYDDIKILKIFSFRQKTIIRHSYFNSREGILFDLKYSLISIFAIKLIIRNIIRIIILNKRKRKKLNKK